MNWDPKLGQRGVIKTPAVPTANWYWRLVEGRYMPGGGKHHIYFDVVDSDGARLLDMPVIITNGGEAIIRTEHKPEDEPSGNFPMFAAGHAYSARVGNAPSDLVMGMGLGTIEEPYVGHHVSYYFKWQYTSRGDGSGPPEPPSPPEPLPLGEFINEARRIEQAIRAEVNRLGQALDKLRV